MAKEKFFNEAKWLVEKSVDIAWIKANLDYDKDGKLGGQVWEILADFYNRDHKKLGVSLTAIDYFTAYRFIVDVMEGGNGKE